MIELSSLAVCSLPLPILVDDSFSFWQGGVEFLPLVAGVVHLPILVEVEGKLVSLEHPDGGNAAVVVLPEEAGGGEGILVELVQPLEHPPHQVAGHEDLSELRVVPVVASPDGIAGRIKL